MSWLTELGYNDKRDKENPLFTQETKEKTVDTIQRLVRDRLVPESNHETAVSYVFFDYPEDFMKAFFEDHGFDVSIENLDEAISYIKFVIGCDSRGRPQKDEGLDKIRDLLIRSNIPFLTIFETNGKFQFPRVLFDSTIHYYFGEHSSGSAHYYRPDLKETFRSSWEANVARVLRHLDIPYGFETQMLQRHEKDGSVSGVYIPDFWILENQIIEVKGFWDRESRDKVLEIKKYYPNYKYYIIDQDIYLSLSKEYSKKIPAWEDEHSKTDYSAAQKLQVVGVTYGARRQVVQKINVGDPVNLLRDPGNPYDQDAILVKTLGGEEIGFLSADWACIYAQKLDIGMEYSCSVISKEDKKITISASRKNPDEVILFDFLKE